MENKNIAGKIKNIKIKKYILLSPVFFLLFAILYCGIDMNNTRKMKSKNTFGVMINEIYMHAKNEYENNTEIKSYGNINGESCRFEFDQQIGLPGTNYYVELDSEGNVIKLYVSDNDWEYENDKIISSYEDLADVKEKVSKSKGFKFDCKGNILSR